MPQVQRTPNPNSLKVVCEAQLVDGSLVVSSPGDAHGHPLAEALMGLEGVRDLFFLNNFVTVSKTDDASWDSLLPEVERVVTEHLE